MSKKRRMFDIDMPDDLETFPAGKVEMPGQVTDADAQAPAAPRRGPMATAISETAESLAERGDIERKIREENDALAHEHVRLKREGLITDRIPLAEVRTSKLKRDRMEGLLDEEMEELIDSIADIGLSNPIRVEPLPGGGYELIQGMRRLTAFRRLLDETGDADRYGTIPAGIMAEGEDIETLYRRMVDENLVRKDISFGEMALLALRYAEDRATGEDDPDKVVALLYKSAGYTKRSYIRAFVRLMRRLEGIVRFPQEIPRALGLQLLARMEEVEGVPAAIKRALSENDNRSVVDEVAVLRRFAGGEVEEETFPAGKVSGGAGGSKARAAKTTFQVERPEGTAKCTAGAGRLELRLDKDFSAVDRRKLEIALVNFLSSLD